MCVCVCVCAGHGSAGLVCVLSPRRVCTVRSYRFKYRTQTADQSTAQGTVAHTHTHAKVYGAHLLHTRTHAHNTQHTQHSMLACSQCVTTNLTMCAFVCVCVCVCVYTGCLRHRGSGRLSPAPLRLARRAALPAQTGRLGPVGRLTRPEHL